MDKPTVIEMLRELEMDPSEIPDDLLESLEDMEEIADDFFTPENQYESIGEGCFRRTPSQHDE